MGGGVGGVSPGRTFGPVVSGPVRLGVAVATVDHVAVCSADDVGCAAWLPPQAASAVRISNDRGTAHRTPGCWHVPRGNKGGARDLWITALSVSWASVRGCRGVGRSVRHRKVNSGAPAGGPARCPLP